MVVRAGVIPTSIRDETGAIARREADANDRLAMLFHTLLAKREDRIFQANLRREMAAQSDANWYDRFNYTQQFRDQSQPQRFRSPGAQGSDIGTEAPSVTSPSGGVPTMPGGSNIPDHTKFSGGDTPVVSDEARNTFAQAPPQTPQQIQEGKAANKIRPSGSSRVPTTDLPAMRNVRRPRPQALYEGLTPQILAAWDDAERKYGLPKGQLLYTHGLETDGGRDLGRADGKGPQGPFQWTAQLLKEKGLTVRDAQDPIKMGYASAKNMAENHDQLVKRTTAGGQAIQLTNGAEDMRSWHILHQWGRTGGPSIVAAGKLSPGMPMVKALPMIKQADGTETTAGHWLVNNGLSSEATVADAYKQLEDRGKAWRTAAITGQGVLPDTDSPQQAQQRQASPPPQSQRAAPAGPQVAGGVPPRPRETVPPSNDAVAWLESRAKPGTNMRGLNPEYANSMANLLQKAEAATGVRARITSGHRTYEEQAELRRRYERGEGGLAARPGRSRHEGGNAIDVGHGPVLQYLRENRQLVAQHGGEFLTGRAGAVDRVHIQRSGERPQGYGVFLGNKPNPQVPATTAGTSAAPQQVAQAQPRVPVDKYPSPTRMPSEVRTDVTQDFRGPTSRPWDGVTGTATAAPAPAPTTQQQPPTPTPLPQGIRPQGADMPPPPGWSPPAQTEQVPLPRPRTIPQGVDVTGTENVPMPPARPPMQLDMPMPLPRPADLGGAQTRSIADAQGAPSVDEAGMSAYAPPLGAPSMDEAGMVIPPDYSGAQGVDETGFDQYLPPPPVNPQDMGTGEDYSGAQSVDEAGMELHGQRKELPGTSIGNIRQPYTRADRRDMAARGEQPEPQWRPPGSVSAGDWIADMVRRAKGGGTTQDGGAPILDMPLPPQGGGDVAQAMPGASTRSIAEPQQVADPGAIADMGAPSGNFDEGDAGAIGDIPPAIDDLPSPTMPPPQFDERGAGAPGNMSPETLAAMKQAMFNMKLPPPGPNAPTPENNAIVREKLRDLAAHTAPARIAQMVQEGGIPKRVGDAASSVADVARAIFSKGTPSVTGKGVATVPPPNAPMAPGRPVKVERYNYNPDGSKRFEDGPPIQIVNPNQGRATTSTTPIPYDTGAPGAPAGAPAVGVPPPPKAGAGAKWRQWRMPNGQIINTPPGQDPPPGAQQVK